MTKIDVKIKRKSMKSVPSWVPGASKIGHGTVLGHPGLPKELPRKIRSVPGAPWEYPESVPERAESPQGQPGSAERAHGRARERTKVTKINAVTSRIEEKQKRAIRKKYD